MPVFKMPICQMPIRLPVKPQYTKWQSAYLPKANVPICQIKFGQVAFGRMLQHQMISNIYCKNALAYFGGAKATRKKSFMALAPGPFRI
jgi:hypothetical protein